MELDREVVQMDQVYVFLVQEHLLNLFQFILSNTDSHVYYLHLDFVQVVGSNLMVKIEWVEHLASNSQKILGNV